MCLLISKESMYFFCPYFYHRHHAQLFSCVQLFAALWTTARQGKKKKSSPSGSSVHGILQTRILEWVAIPFSRGSSQPRNRTWDSCIQADSSPSEPPGTPLSCAWIQFSSVTQSCLILSDPMNRSTPGLPVHHQLPEFTQTHVHPVSDAIQPSHPLSSPSPPPPNPSQHQGIFQWVSSSHEVACVCTCICIWSISISSMLLSRFSRVRLCATP